MNTFNNLIGSSFKVENMHNGFYIFIIRKIYLNDGKCATISNKDFLVDCETLCGKHKETYTLKSILNNYTILK
jgi:hypothetical protein